MTFLRGFCLSFTLLLLLPLSARALAEAYVEVLTDAEAWKRLPPAETGAGQPLPAWIRALAGSLPETAAAMVALDYTQRVDNPVPPRLRAKLRWYAAHANRCPYTEAYAAADYVRAGGTVPELHALLHDMSALPEEERRALQLVRRLMEAGYTVSNAEIARLVQLMGEKQVVAIVLVAAYSSFQDRLVLALGVTLEPNGPLPPVKVVFRRPTAPNKNAPTKVVASDDVKRQLRRKLSPPATSPPPVPEKVDDPEWIALSVDALSARLSHQIARPRARIPIPDWETVCKNLPASIPRPKEPTRIVWSLVTMGYQPGLSHAGWRDFGPFEKNRTLTWFFKSRCSGS